jgi:PAS domain S-box-containing protein
MNEAHCSLHPVTLTFNEDSGLSEGTYRAYFINHYLIQSRITIIVGALFYLLFSILDSFLMPESRNLLIGIRLYGVVPCMLLLLGITYIAPSYRRLQAILVLASMAAAAGILAMIALGPLEANTFYYAGLILVFILMYGFLRLRFLLATVVGFITIISYNIIAVFIIQQQLPILVSNNFFLVSSFFLAMVVCYGTERKIRQHYYFQRVLEEKNNENERINKELEALLQHAEDQSNRITELLKTSTDENRLLSSDLHFLTRTMKDLIGILSKKDIFQYITSNIFATQPDCLVFASSYNTQDNALEIESYCADSTLAREALALWDAPLIGHQTTISAPVRQRLLSGELFVFSEGLDALIDRELPQEIMTQIFALLHPQSIWSVGITLDGALLGVATIILQKATEPSSPDRIRTFIHQAAITLQRAEMQQRYRKRDEQFKELVESIGEGVCIMDETYAISYINPAAIRILEVENTNITAMNALSFVAGDKIHAVMQQLSTMPTNMATSHEMEITTARQTTRHLLITTTKHHNERGALTSLLVVFRDITHLKEAAYQLQRSLRYEKLISTIAMRFVGVTNLPSAIDITLAEIGTFLNVSECITYKRQDNAFVVDRYWQQPELEHTIIYNSRVLMPECAGVISRLQEKKLITISELSDIPAEAHYLRQQIQTHSIKSMLIAPIFQSGELAGTVCIIDFINHQPWDILEQSLFMVFASILSSAWEQKQQIKTITTTLEQKEILLQEVMHRTKNNLQITSSLMRIQEKFISNSETQAELRKATNRIRTLALIYSNFSEGTHYSSLNIESMSYKVISQLRNRYAITPEQYHVEYQFEIKHIDTNTAIPLGMLIGEASSLLMNNLDTRAHPCYLTISLQKHNEEYQLNITCKEPLNSAALSIKENPQSWEMIRMFTIQLQGDITLFHSPHSILSLCFKQRMINSTRPVFQS